MWLLAESVAVHMKRAEELGLAPTAAQQEDYERRQTAVLEAKSLDVQDDGTAVIRVEGPLSKRPSLFALLFGGGNTTYGQIQKELAAAQSNPGVQRVVMHVDSPGGTVDGLFETLDAIEQFKASGKGIEARASNAQSGAYALAAATGKIQAASRASSFGSIGVAASFFTSANIVDVTSTEAPAKRPDVRTDEGKAVVREHLDAIHELFVEAIAKGRGVEARTVNETFGRGATLLAGEALERKMIDSVAGTALRVVGKKTQSENPMDLKTLKAQHPDVYEAAKADGVKEERDRVGAHLTMGEQAGDMKTAVEAIKSGDGMTLTLQAQYMSAAMNRRDRDARQADSDAAGKAVDGVAAAAATAARDENATAEAVVAEVERLLGVQPAKSA